MCPIFLADQYLLHAAGELRHNTYNSNKRVVSLSNDSDASSAFDTETVHPNRTGVANKITPGRTNNSQNMNVLLRNTEFDWAPAINFKVCVQLA